MVTLLDLTKKNILFVTHAYNNFQKEMIESVSGNFNNCHVEVRSNPVAELSNYISVPFLNRFKLSYKIDVVHLPENISVSHSPIYYLPLDNQYKKLGDKHFKSVDTNIQKNAIKFDLVHSHFTWTSGYVGARLKEKYDVPFIVTAHGYDIYKLPFKDPGWKKRIEYVLNSADHIITVSNSNLECIKKLDVNTPVTILPNGFNSNKFYPRDQNDCRNQLNLPQDKSIILTVGNLEEVKGQKYLIEAMQEVIKSREDVLCYIVGSGPLENKLKKQILAAGLDKYVTLVGAKPHSEIPIWINACDLFVLPSLNEGNPTVLVECLSCGKPFIGTNVGGIPEIVNSVECGILCNPKDSNELANNIFMALNREWSFVEIKKYANQFSWKQISSRIENLYYSILKN